MASMVDQTDDQQRQRGKGDNFKFNHHFNHF
jgi:hypothetical protein